MLSPTCGKLFLVARKVVKAKADPAMAAIKTLV